MDKILWQSPQVLLEQFEDTGSSSEDESDSEDKTVHGKIEQEQAKATRSDSDSESESDAISEDKPKHTGHHLSSVRKPAEAPTSPTSPVARHRDDPFTVKKRKTKTQKRIRDDEKDKEEYILKRKKEDGNKIRKVKHSPSKEKMLSRKNETLQGQKPEEARHVENQEENQESQRRRKTMKESTPVLEKEGGSRKENRKRKSSGQNGSHQDVKSKESEKKEQWLEEEPELKKKKAKKDKSPTEKGLAAEHKNMESKKQIQKQNKQAENEIISLETTKGLVSPQKPRKPAHLWSAKDETALASELMHHAKAGAGIPCKRGDPFWEKLCEDLQGKVDGDWTKEQLCEKCRRMRARYRSMVKKMQAETPKQFKHRNAHDESLFKFWRQIWCEDGEQVQEEDEEEADALKDEVRKTTETSGGWETYKTDDSSDDSEDDEREAEKAPLSQTVAGKKRASAASVLTSLAKKRSSLKMMQLDQKVPLQNNAGNDILKNNKLLHQIAVGGDVPADTFYKLMQSGNQALLEEVQTGCTRMLEEVQAKATTVVENAIKAAEDKLQFASRMTFPGSGCFSMPFLGGWNFMDAKPPIGFDAFQDTLREQWYKQHEQELNVYCKRLQLMEEVFRFQQEQLRLDFQAGKR